MSDECCVHQHFEAQVERSLEAVSVVCEDHCLTYEELNSRANQLAHFLCELGLGPEGLVAICMERSLEMVISLLGTLKAGAAYVPLDPSYPKERLDYMLEDSGASLLLTQEKLRDHVLAGNAQVIFVDSDWVEIACHSRETMDRVISLESPAYVIYTSGSTGKPKGVVISHRAILNHMLWMHSTFPLVETDVVLQKTPFSFDASVWEFYASLMEGARLTMAQPGGHRDSRYLARAVVEQNVSVLQMVPSHLRMLLEERDLTRHSCLHRVFCGGENLPVALQKEFFACLDAELINLYGPTEATIDATYWKCRREGEWSSVPIGRPITNMQAYVLSPRMSPVPIGGAGELYIAGAGLARGYLNCPDLTAEKFVPNPFNEDATDRLYRTGDLVRRHEDGNLEFLRRLDQQVKIRGFRIEIGEIEAVLLGYDAVREAIVLAREDEPGDKRLVAYLTAKKQTKTNTNQLIEYLQRKLPDYMIPNAFVWLDRLPLTPNGKLDRLNLPAPEKLKPELSEGFIPPRTPVEEILAEMWSELLGIKNIGINDNFFELGGHSLQLTQLLSRILQVFQVDLPLRTLFNSPTIDQMVQAILSKQLELEDISEFAEDLRELESMSPDALAMTLKAEAQLDS
jgi:amino acid adenylation domain-containing protein